MTDPTLRFLCVNCGHRPLELAADRAVCGRCRAVFRAEGGVWDFLPSSIEENKVNEDKMHVKPQDGVWRDLVMKKSAHIKIFEKHILPRLITPKTRTFLEVGAGLGYVSALVKLARPDVSVTTSDISPNYLRNKTAAVHRIMGAPVDRLVACDGEKTPFEDGQFDAIFLGHSLHHFLKPAEALREIRRLLAPGGVMEIGEVALPYVRRGPSMRRKEAFMREHGVKEHYMTWFDWRRCLREASLPESSLEMIPAERIKSFWVRLAANAVRALNVHIHYQRT